MPKFYEISQCKHCIFYFKNVSAKMYHFLLAIYNNCLELGNWLANPAKL